MSDYPQPQAETIDSRIKGIEKKIDFIVDFIEHCHKIAAAMSKHPMFASMLPPEIRNMGAKKE